MRIETLQSMTAARLAVITTDTPLRSAAVALSSSRIGLLVVCDETRRATGVLSKSDIVRHLTDQGVIEAPAGSLMTRNVISCRPEDDLYATWQRMGVHSVQNMPVLGADCKPLGVLDVRDALKTLFEQEEYEEQLLSNYVAGIGYQ